MKRCIQKFKKMIQSHQKWVIVLVFGVFSVISALVLIILVGIKTIEWNWLTGYFLGFAAALTSILILVWAIKRLLKDENYFLYYFFYTLRLGFYAAPFLLTFLIPINVFGWQGVLIGFFPVVALPFLKDWLGKDKR